MVAFQSARSSAPTGSTLTGRRAAKGALRASAGKGSTERWARRRDMRSPLGGRWITPMAAHLRAGVDRHRSHGCPFGAFHGRFSQTVLASSERLSCGNRYAVHRMSSTSTCVNSRSPIQNGASYPDAAVHHPDATV